MNTWTPVWSKLPDSSIWLESKEVKILFMTMLAIKDRDHVVRYSAFELARKANLSEAEVLEALDVLKNPDTKRMEPQEFEGRRISKVEDGWLMLNGEKYRKKMQELYRKEYKRIKQAEYREDPAPKQPGIEPGRAKLEIPKSLSVSGEFLTWWSRWIEHLKAKKKTPTTHTIDLQLRKLEKMGYDLAVTTIKNSIEKGYQGLFEPNTSSSPSTKPGADQPDPTDPKDIRNFL